MGGQRREAKLRRRSDGESYLRIQRSSTLGCDCDDDDSLEPMLEPREPSSSGCPRRQPLVSPSSLRARFYLIRRAYLAMSI